MRVRVVRFFTLAGIFLLCLAAMSCRDTAAKPTALGTFNMGEKAQVGPLIYTVFDSKWEISLGEQPTPRIPNHRFYLLSVSAVNTNATPYSIPAFSLVDDDGKVYPELDNGEGVPDWMGVVRRVQPADSAKGTILFDVPQKRFKLRIADEEDRFAFVNIPLSLGEAPPDIGIKAAPR